MKTANLLQLLAAGSLCLIASVRATAADREAINPPTVTVRLYNLAKVKPVELQKAAAEASWIFGKAGLNLAWVHCSPVTGDLPADDPCREVDDPLVFSLGVTTQAPDFLQSTGLGFALVFSGGRNHAGVLYPRVSDLARANSLIVQKDQVLAYAMTHEIAHLILGSTAHSATGIMRAACRSDELKAVSQRRLLFGADEIEALHRKLSERSHGLEIIRAARIQASRP